MFVDGRIDEVLAFHLGRSIHGKHLIADQAASAAMDEQTIRNLDCRTDGVYPYDNRGWRAQRAGLAKTCTDGKSVRADRRLRTDDVAIRTQATISREPVLLILQRVLN